MALRGSNSLPAIHHRKNQGKAKRFHIMLPLTMKIQLALTTNTRSRSLSVQFSIPVIIIPIPEIISSMLKPVTIHSRLLLMKSKIILCYCALLKKILRQQKKVKGNSNLWFFSPIGLCKLEGKIFPILN